MALLACVAAAVVPWLVTPGLPAVLPALAAGAAVYLGFLSSGWLGPRALAGATWSPEGEWCLTRRDGVDEPGRLLPDSRVFAHWLWLRWEAPSGRHQALLLRASLQADAVRRLAVRLRLQGTRPAGGSDSLT